MLNIADSRTATEYSNDDEQIWHNLFTWLLPIVEKWVLYADVSCWQGQQKEVSEDIAQEGTSTYVQLYATCQSR